MEAVEVMVETMAVVLPTSLPRCSRARAKVTGAVKHCPGGGYEH